MAKASINFAKSSTGSFAHNDRTISPKYLIDDPRLNQVSCSASQAQAKWQELFHKAKLNYEKQYGQKFQTNFTNTHWEAVVNLNAHHTLEDVKKLADRIIQETGFTTLQISIHRDEGHVTDSGKKEKNYHAHINFFTCDQETGQQLYRRSVSKSERERIRRENNISIGQSIPKHLTAVMDRAKLSKLQDITADVLNMERGDPNRKAKRLNHREYKSAVQTNTIKDREIEKLQREIKKASTTNEQLQYSFQTYRSKIVELTNVDIVQRRELHRLNTEINKIKADDINKSKKVAELELKIETLKKSNQTKDKIVTQLAMDISALPTVSTVFNAELIANTIASHFKNIEIKTQQIQHELLDDIAEIHVAITQNVPISEIKQIVKRQEYNLLTRYRIKEPYKTALERREEAYRARFKEKAPSLQSPGVSNHRNNLQSP